MTTLSDPNGGSAGDDFHLAEQQLSSDEILAGNFLQVRRDTVSLPDGRHTTREYVVHPGAVMIVALLDDGRVVLERQYRYPLHAVMIEFPAGKLDAGESSLACAKRELQEETGYTAREWARAGVLHPVISYSTEFIDIWFARGLTAGEQNLDSGEFLEVFSATPDELMSWCGSGQVTDAKTLTGMLWLNNMLSGAWALEWHAAQR
jgi:ADP-ribose pyrophosphatase